ncbi:MAG TPA: hypothetical protein VGQ99_00945 [Tepidisphaeraceae bacterium]|jgi:hypothetical protein|nr:hypothetical protein [Tepidisphaeraceae bacterium]
MLMRHCALVGVLVVAFSPLWACADHLQYTLPYNVDVVREPGGTAFGIGVNGGAFVTQSYAAANDSVSPRGLPDSGLIGNVQLGPYNGKNALLLGPNQGVCC